ncbi:hypothetical protein AGMMS49573_10560 [Endomicrobiia bacterium]|nr:hypothetical protein AGMMS49573_10560 [Endomicrobiia bacterium]
MFNKKASKDEILKIVEQLLRLEFLISLAILKKLINALGKYKILKRLLLNNMGIIYGKKNRIV